MVAAPTFLACRYAKALAISVAKLNLNLQGNGLFREAKYDLRFPPEMNSEMIFSPTTSY
jgi:hypothetical protein